jgi:hypothetical protein
MSPPHDVFTPFSRRFTDERAYNFTQVKAFYTRVRSAHRLSRWGKPDAIANTHGTIAERLAEVIELPTYTPLCEALDSCIEELLTLETQIFAPVTVNLSTPLPPKNQVELNRQLRAQEHFLANQEQVADLLINAVGNVAATVIHSLPPLADSPLSIPLISLVPNPREFVSGLIDIFAGQELADAGLCSSIRDRLYENACTFSGIPTDGSAKKPVIWPEKSDLNARDVVDTYLAGTPLHSLLLTPCAFVLPDEQRYSGHWIIAPPGRGKTTLLHSMVMDDLKKDAAVILMDSKGDLIEPIRNLKEIGDRLVVIDPDPRNPIGLNPLDVPTTDITHAIGLLEYVFSSLLESKLTASQSTLFRSVLRALITTFPNPTLETFRDILTNGYKPYIEHIKKLPADLQDFFFLEFNTKVYEDRKKEVIWRLRLLLENETIRAMLLALHTRFHIGAAMDAGKVIIINTSKSTLGDQGSEFFGRFFIAQVLAAAQQRAGRRPEEKKPCYFYIDECQTVIARDEKIPTILDECRSQKIALILAHQRTTQITSPNVLDALSNCGIRYTNSDDEARTLAPKLRTTPAVLQSLKRGSFAGFVRDMTPHAVIFTVGMVDFGKHAKLTPAEHNTLRERMQILYGAETVDASPEPAPTATAPIATPQQPTPPTPPAEEPPGDWATKW